MGKWIKFGVSLLVTVVCLWWTFKDTQLDPILNSVKSANWAGTMPLYLLSLVAIHIFRTLRWGNLLSPLEKVPFKQLNEASAIGFMMLLILPFRLGEFARPVLIAQRSNIKRSAAMTSVVLERIIDGLIIATMLWVLMFFIPPDAPDINRIRAGATAMFVVFGGGFLFLLAARWRHDLVVSLMRKTAGRIAAGPTEKIIGIVDNFVGALKQLPDAKNLSLFFLWTTLYWFLNGVGCMYLANAFDCSGAAAGTTCYPLHITLFQGYFVLCVMIVGMLIPAAPGSAGTAQYFLKLGLSVFVTAEVANSSGVAYANVVWLIQIIQQVSFGVIFLIASHASFSDIAGKLSAEQKDPAA